MSALIEKLIEKKGLDFDEYLNLIISRTPELQSELQTLAAETAKHYYGNEIYLRGLIEVSNYCKNNCLYCGIRRDNCNVPRYRLSPGEIMDCCGRGYSLGFQTFVLQGGEDPWFSDNRLTSIIREIKASFPNCAVTISLGERERESYAALKQMGADRYLLRHETGDKTHYEMLHPPEMSFENRRQCLRNLKDLGFQTGAGFMVGSPGQSPESLAKDMMFLQELRPQMVGIGPFIAHHETPFAGSPPGTATMTLFMLSLARLLLPKALIPATTALGTVVDDGWERGILAGANVIMLNLTPEEEKANYNLYDNKNGTTGEEKQQVSKRMEAIGYKITDARGDYPLSSRLLLGGYFNDGEGI